MTSDDPTGTILFDHTEEELHAGHEPDIVFQRAARRLDTAAWGVAAAVTTVLAVYAEAIEMQHSFLLLVGACFLTKWRAKDWILYDAVASYEKAKAMGHVVIDKAQPRSSIRIMAGCKRPWFVTLYVELVEFPKLYKVDKR